MTHTMGRLGLGHHFPRMEIKLVCFSEWANVIKGICSKGNLQETHGREESFGHCPHQCKLYDQTATPRGGPFSTLLLLLFVVVILKIWP